MTTKLAVILGIFLILGGFKSYAQVTIGSSDEPARAALLEIKTKNADAPTSATDPKNVTTDVGGLALPRVWLKDRTTLEPFVSTTDTDWANATTTKIKEKHVGLTVYNLNNSSTTSPAGTDLKLLFNQGVYVWDGAQWSQVGDSRVGERYFHMPAFNLPLKKVTQTGDTKPTYDLYGEYKKQFTKDSGNPLFKSSIAMDRVPSPGYDRLYTEKELDYVVTYYDNTVLNITGIDTNGLMTYEVKDVDPGPNAFINIVFVIK